ncbi:unnamed protein product [Alternaria alternata]
MPATLSSRGWKINKESAGENLIWKVCADLWDPVTNPDGYVSLGMAENALMHEELREYLLSRPLIDASSKAFTYGDGPSGSKQIKTAVASFFEDHFAPAKPVRAEHLVITNGVTSALEHAAWALADPGDGILVGRPYYRAFIMDMEQRPNVRMVPVSFNDVDPFGPGCVAQYEEALLAAQTTGIKIRAILLCHPHNPLGRCYSKAVLMKIMQLCEKYQVHLISDEIYALSTWENSVDGEEHNTEHFTSVLSMPLDGLISPNLVHVLWGTSKDFGANGLRIGVLISQTNKELIAACSACAIFSSPSSLAENAVTEVLSDRGFLSAFVVENKKRLSAAYEHATRLLKQHEIEYMPGATAGFFLWVNLGKSWQRTSRNSEASENAAIFEALLQKKIFVVSGDSAGAEHPGWFRIVFSQKREVVTEAISRIANVVS